MIILRTPAELAATVRKVAARLPSHQHAEASDLNQAADRLDAIGAPADPKPRRNYFADTVADLRRLLADSKEKP